MVVNAYRAFDSSDIFENFSSAAGHQLSCDPGAELAGLAPRAAR
jgi:hypothetical protein